MLTVHSLQSEPKVRLGAEAPAITPDVRSKIDAIWQREKTERGDKLFNGKLFSIHQSGPQGIVGWMAEYRHFLAQQRDESLQPLLRIRPLAVSGILMCRDGLVFGRRTGHAGMDANLWELVPSGSIDDAAVDRDHRVNVERCLLSELEEETGIPSSEIASPARAVALVEDPRSHVTDIGMLLSLDWSATQVLHRFATLENHEYTALEVVAVSVLSEFRSQHAGSLSEVSAALLDFVVRQH